MRKAIENNRCGYAEVLPPASGQLTSEFKARKELGYKTVFWSLAYADWYTDRQPSKEEALNKLIREYSAVVPLQHPIRHKILDELLTRWKKRDTAKSLDMLFLHGEKTP